MKIAVLASGGVDSSVALHLLKNEGHDITAFYLKIWLEDELKYLGSCPWEEDLAYVQEICRNLNIPLEVVSMQKEYWDEVVDYALSEIKVGRTPNSDIMCNYKVKSGKFYDKISKEYEAVATGHYAQKEVEIVAGKEIHHLKKAKDSFKDQTYFLAHLTQSQLARALFPIGHLLKSEVRELAKQFNLPNQSRKDSQGICFLGKIKFPSFLKAHFGEKEGDLIEYETGNILGKHLGYWYYTLGQRKDIRLSGGPWFVVKKDIEKNIIYISKVYHESYVRNEFEVSNYNWISKEPTKEQLANLKVKVRHGETLYDCELNENKVKISGSDQAFAPGQFSVFYSNETCLGCATIS